MHDDPFPAAEKILTDIENIFKRNKDLRDFEILPVTVGENKSPVLYAENTLGLEEWCVRHLYLHVYHKLMNLKQNQRLRREDPSIVSRILLGGVLLNPDCSSLWNIRREFVVMGRFDPLFELQINAVTLSRRPKSSEAFVYRRWILNRILAKAEQFDTATSTHLIEAELRVTLMAADRYANNYHAWNHRMWVMSHFPQSHEYLIDEWATSEEWVSRHVSEHSGLHYRQYLFKQLVETLLHTSLCLQLNRSIVQFFLPLSSCSFKEGAFKDTGHSKHLHSRILGILENKETFSSCPIHLGETPFLLHVGLLAGELLLDTELIKLYPGHEALWCHRRFIMFSFHSLAKKIFSNALHESDITDGVPLPKAQKLSVLETDFEDGFLWQVVLSHDNNLFEECTSSSPVECYQSKLAHMHHKWLEEVLLSRSQPSSVSKST